METWNGRFAISVELDDLKNKVTIPQDETLFTGAIRSNLGLSTEYAGQFILSAIKTAISARMHAIRTDDIVMRVHLGNENCSA
uniref:Uncharacterized protein n=1 Tax=Tetranychus urticae TaxID=32264 RepID=T1KPD6_TETUR